jgi:predicted nucleic acid-binding protein
MTTLVDANVLLDVITEDERWMAWSADALTEAAARGGLAINPIVYAELSLGYDTIGGARRGAVGLHAAAPSLRGWLPRRGLLPALPARPAEHAARRCPTSTSARTPPSTGTSCSNATSPATAATFRPWQSSPPDSSLASGTRAGAGGAGDLPAALAASR